MSGIPEWGDGGTCPERCRVVLRKVLKQGLLDFLLFLSRDLFFYNLFIYRYRLFYVMVIS